MSARHEPGHCELLSPRVKIRLLFSSGCPLSFILRPCRRDCSDCFASVLAVGRLMIDGNGVPPITSGSNHLRAHASLLPAGFIELREAKRLVARDMYLAPQSTLVRGISETLADYDDSDFSWRMILGVVLKGTTSFKAQQFAKMREWYFQHSPETLVPTSYYPYDLNGVEVEPPSSTFSVSDRDETFKEPCDPVACSFQPQRGQPDRYAVLQPAAICYCADSLRPLSHELQVAGCIAKPRYVCEDSCRLDLLDSPDRVVYNGEVQPPVTTFPSPWPPPLHSLGTLTYLALFPLLTSSIHPHRSFTPSATMAAFIQSTVNAHLALIAPTVLTPPGRCMKSRGTMSRSETLIQPHEYPICLLSTCLVLRTCQPTLMASPCGESPVRRP